MGDKRSAPGPQREFLFVLSSPNQPSSDSSTSVSRSESPSDSSRLSREQAQKARASLIAELKEFGC